MGDPKLSAALRSRLRIPVFAGPMFIASTADLVIAQSKAGIIGAMPALNPRSTAALDGDIAKIREALGPEGLYAINLVAHRTNDRLEADYAVVEKHKVPIVVLALAANADLVKGVHGYGGLVFNDVVKDRHARRCAELGVDGIIAVCAGAGGHTGALSPFALVNEIRQWWQGPLALGGAIVTGAQVLAAEAMGADLAYIGSPFLASDEAYTQPAFKRMVVESGADDIVVSNAFTGAKASFLRPSLIANGLDPDNLVRPADMGGVDISDGGMNAKAWRDIWSAGQGIGAIKESGPAQHYIDKLVREYDEACEAMKIRLAGQ